MKIITSVILFVVISLSCFNCSVQEKSQISSPDGDIVMEFWLEKGSPFYSASYKDKEIVSPSALGIVLENNDTISAKLNVIDTKCESVDETWEQVWGQQHVVRNNYNGEKFTLAKKEGSNRIIEIEFRVFNDGIGFRYSIPEQENMDTIIIIDELTEFAMVDNHQAWWIPALKDNRYEYLYNCDPVSDLDTVHTPLTMEAADGKVISIHEAALIDYAGMTLANTGNNVLKCYLAPLSNGNKVEADSPLKTPWRTIQVADSAADLITSTMILNLNEPNKIENTSWITPMKYLGIWWGMHIGKYSFWESNNHGASTTNSKEYIDYCGDLGIDNLLIEGWNIGWTPQWYENRMHVFSFTEGTSDFDFDEVTDYADKKGVNVIGYHETGSNIINYISQIDSGMTMYHDAGMNSVKIGQVGSKLNMEEWHYSQFGVNYYQFVLDKAADYQLTVNFHEPVKPTGLSRTYPHLMAGEGARGQEYNAWSEGNPPEHTVIIPFTRLLGGPMDFTPGIFDITSTRVHTTIAKQLALYLTIYSPIQMLADLPENYIGNPAFKFLQDVPVDWDTTYVVNAKIGDYYTVARKDIDSDDWYLGSITDENDRSFTIDLDFLDNGKEYEAQIYSDGKDAEYDKNPESIDIITKTVSNNSQLTLNLAKGGGQAIRFMALN